MGKKILSLDQRIVLELLSDYDNYFKPHKCISNLPDDVKVLSVHENHAKRTFDYVIESSEFEETSNTCMLPEFDYDLSWINKNEPVIKPKCGVVKRKTWKEIIFG